MKRLIGIILSLIIVISCTTPISVQAKVIEPEVVKTESWETSYSIGNAYGESGLYGPYPCSCVCDVYNTGDIYVYVEYKNLPSGDICIRLDENVPIVHSGCFKYERSTTGSDFTTCHIFGDNFYPDTYNITYNNFVRFDHDGSDSNVNYKYFYEEPVEYIEYFGLVRSDCFPFANIITDTNKPETLFKNESRTLNTYIIKLYPICDIDGLRVFRLFGHDITITPELLSGNIVAEPELTEQEKYIKQLEEENKRLKASIANTNSFGDINGDNLVDVADAQMILNYYVYTLVAYDPEPLEEWISKQ